MTRRQKIALVCGALALLAAIAGYEARLVAQQSEQLAVLQRQQTRDAAELATLRRARTTITNDLATAEQQLAQLPTRTQAAEEATRAAELSAWIGRVATLRALLERKPAQAIPEMQLLAAADWLRVAKAAKFETDDDQREALAALRTAAKDKFHARLREAARAYVKSGRTEPPAGLHVLAPYFQPQVDPAILARYEVTTTAQRSSLPGEPWGVRERAAIDEDFDSRTTITPTGTSSGSGLAAWDPNYRERQSKAMSAYRAAHQGARPENFLDVLPYFDPPLDPARIERMQRQARAGGW